MEKWIFIYFYWKWRSCRTWSIRSIASATVTERLNGLFDQKYDDTEKTKFDVPENPQKPEIIINKNFRLVCTSDINKIIKCHLLL